MEIIPLLLLVLVCCALLFGYPVAFTLSGVSILFAIVCIPFGIFDISIFKSIPLRIFGIMNNVTLLAVPLFIFMGTVLEKSGIATKMLTNMALAFRNIRGGLSISIIVVGALLAASTGIVGATVVTMGLMSLPILIQQGYKKDFSSGLIASTGTLGQIIPPSIALVLLGDVMSNAYQRAQNDMGVFSQKTVTVGDLFVGAIVPGLLICLSYLIYTVYKNSKNIDIEFFPNAKSASSSEILKTLALPLILIILVLGSIFSGIATPTEASAIGAMGALLIAIIDGKFTLSFLKEASEKTAIVSTMIFTILIGASIFSLIFRGVGGDALIDLIFSSLPGGPYTALIFVLLLVFLLGFILDFIEICYVIVPLVAPPLLMMGFDPVWLAILLAINLQTSFLTPPFGFSLFYLRGVAHKSIQTSEIYKGVIPFIFIQLLILGLVLIFPFIVL
ncbi:MAG: TRAP transporter large permease subunit [Gammaproteobacteria bacterium]|uniref:TRAP transporter large permease protein n=1 Tax=SAR86 cluster bacterium TaxID=2030880 RepID=A0A520MPW3_9GAMM|nr:MAG: C4-dicarboxylate ABC transporter [Gammaproteobacteria bacterium TMED242]RZO23235.1 MAG: TRAP transporter large permease subunit [SAR86 cluster bacterium]|tara:strand:- start:380 stop:1717 length:1338 start_codon:yes stop_codon:yes gene_type:complete